MYRLENRGIERNADVETNWYYRHWYYFKRTICAFSMHLPVLSWRTAEAKPGRTAKRQAAVTILEVLCSGILRTSATPCYSERYSKEHPVLPICTSCRTGSPHRRQLRRSPVAAASHLSDTKWRHNAKDNPVLLTKCARALILELALLSNKIVKKYIFSKSRILNNVINGL